jgi:VIT1/CCC1 family predicted Fe2+/Mn2+ transporter
MSSWFRWIDPARVRAHVADVNDGIIAVAAMSEGLAGAGTPPATIWSVIILTALAGATSVAGVRFGEVSAGREVELGLVEEEKRLLALSPEEEIAELAAFCEAKGLNPALARQVADELSARDALAAQLEAEFGLRELTAASTPWLDGLLAGVAFLTGAAVPVTIAWAFPGPWLEESTLLAAVTSLTVTSIVLARLGHTQVWRTILRSLVVGAASLGLTALVGALVA